MGLFAGVVSSMQQQMGQQGMKVANISQSTQMPQKWLAYWLLGVC